MFSTIKTSRLLIRQAEPGDADALAERRSDPKVAEFQNWTIPYPLERALAMVQEVANMDGPTNEEWWMASVCLPESGEVIGDLALHMTQEMRTAEVGYTFATEYWGRGYATEATQALVDFLFEEMEVTRVFGMLHPDNPASATVLERVGMLYEGHTRASFWLDGEVSDDLIYGMTRSDHEDWKGRPRGAPDAVELVEVDAQNARELAQVESHHSQRRFVAPNLQSFADALFPEVVDGAPLEPWMRGIRADGALVGFVMLASATEQHPEPYLWRLLIDRLHQRRGIAMIVMDQIEESLRRKGATGIVTSWGVGKGSPEAFYVARGYQPTGTVIDGEIEARLDLSS